MTFIIGNNAVKSILQSKIGYILKHSTYDIIFAHVQHDLHMMRTFENIGLFLGKN